MATIFGQKKPWCKLRMMMTLMEVKGHQTLNGVNYVLWLPYLVKRSADASWEWWWPWCRSKVIRGQMGANYVLWLPFWSKEALMQAKNDDDLDGGQRSSDWEWWWPWWRSKVIRGQMGQTMCYGYHFGQKKHRCKLRMMMTLMEVKGHQRSNVVNYVICLPYLVKRIGDAS